MIMLSVPSLLEQVNGFVLFSKTLWIFITTKPIWNNNHDCKKKLSQWNMYVKYNYNIRKISYCNFTDFSWQKHYSKQIFIDSLCPTRSDWGTRNPAATKKVQLMQEV